jgi:hypothetical protein
MQHNSGTKTTNHAEESTQVNRVQVNRVQVNRVQVNQLVEEGLEQVWIAEHRYLRTSTIPTLICLVLCPLSRPLPLTLNNFRLREKLGQCLWEPLSGAQAGLYLLETCHQRLQFCTITHIPPRFSPQFL